MNELKLIQNTQTMSSLEIAKLTGKEHKNVLADIRRILEEMNEGGELRFERTYLSEQNKELPCFNLPRRECDIVISGYSLPYRVKIIDRWQELESKNQLPRDYPAALRALADEAEAHLKTQLALTSAKEEVEDLQIELDASKEWLSIKKVAQYNDMHWKEILWRPLKKHGISVGLVPHKIFDANFPMGVNVYHRESWAAVYPALIMPGDEI